jgi:hypothetical protein
MLSQKIREILSNPLPPRWWKKSGSKPIAATQHPKKKERLVVETLEPRILLSADFPVIAPILSNGIDQLDDTLDGFFSHELLNTPLPGISLYEQIDEQTGKSYAPTLNDLLSIDVSTEDTNTEGATPQEVNQKLKDLDSNADGKLTIQEFSDGIVAQLQGFLDNASEKTSDELKQFLETELEQGISDYLDISNANFLTNPESSIVSLDFNFKNAQAVSFDLGTQAEKLGITLKSELDLTQFLNFTLEFGVNDADGLSQDDFFYWFQRIRSQSQCQCNFRTSSH